MTMVGCPVMFCPLPPPNLAGTPAGAGVTLDAVNDAVATVFIVPKTGTIASVSFYNAAVNGVSGSVTMEVRVETINSSGFPSGTLLGTNSNGTVSVAFNGDNAWQTVALTNSVSVSAGQQIAIVVKVSAFVGAASSIQITRFQDSTLPNVYGVEDLTGAGYAVASNKYCYQAFPVYSGGVYYPCPGFYPGYTNGTVRTFNSGSSPNKRGMKFQVPTPMRLSGFWIWLDLDADCVVKLYAADGTTVLAQKTINSQIDTVTTPEVYSYFFDASEVAPGYYDLAASTNYYLSVEPSSGSDITIYDLTYPSNAYLGLFDGGINWYSSTNTGGTWTDADTIRPWIGLIFNGFDDGASAGGGFYIGSL